MQSGGQAAGLAGVSFSVLFQFWLKEKKMKDLASNSVKDSN